MTRISCPLARAVSTARVREFLPDLDTDVEAYQRRFAARATEPYLAQAS